MRRRTTGAPKVSESIFFDLDGTLTDPKPGITGSIQFALERLGRPVPSKDELEWCIGPPLLDNFTRLVGAGEAAVAVDLYRERYGDVGLFENEVYEGIKDVLASVRRKGVQLYVASSKPHVYVNRILEHFGLSSQFDGVFGSELDGTRTNKVDLLRYALAETGVSVERSTMVGDRGMDVAGALANEMAFVGVLYGYGSIEELREAGAVHWVESPKALVDALAR
jgi:phosphoglycolate phosphatase